MAIIQRFGAALSLNIHVHALVLDGVYVEDGPALRFHEADAHTDDEWISCWARSSVASSDFWPAEAWRPVTMAPRITEARTPG